jgi:hypothetical protein
MSRSYFVGVVMIALLAFPHVSSAGLMDYIHAMSGPQMIGGIVHCKIYFDGPRPQCKILDDLLKGKDAIRRLDDDHFGPGEWRISVETIAYLATGKNADGNDYRRFDVQMVAVDPMFEVRSGNYNDLRFYHGVGASLNRLFVNDRSDFGNIGVKIRPVAFTFPSGFQGVDLDIAINVRWYPDGFGSDQFGFGPLLTGDRPNERVYGFSWGFAW